MSVSLKNYHLWNKRILVWQSVFSKPKNIRAFCNRSESTDNNKPTSSTLSAEEMPKYEKKIPPEPPTNCCRSNCANCVWIDYAQDMLEYYKDGGHSALKIIEQLDDENLKAFLKMELKFRMKRK